MTVFSFLTLFLPVVFGSSIVFACPNLTGTYVCKTPEVPGGDPYLVVVNHTASTYSEKMFLENGSEVVEEYLADGKSHGTAFSMRYQVFCEQSKPMTIKYKSTFVTAIIEHVPTNVGFTKYRRTSESGKREIFKVCVRRN
jgi:hypothetical protein